MQLSKCASHGGHGHPYRATSIRPAIGARRSNQIGRGLALLGFHVAVFAIGATIGDLSQAVAKDRGSRTSGGVEVRRSAEQPRETSRSTREQGESRSSNDSARTEEPETAKREDVSQRESSRPELKVTQEPRTRQEKETEREKESGKERKELSKDKGASKDYDDARKVEVEREPPRTVAEALERMFKPTAKDAPKPRPTVTPASLPPSLAPIGNQSFVNGEVLAINLKPAAIDRAKALGYRVASLATLARSNATIVRLIAPPGLDVAQARQQLKQELPNEAFALNRVYRPYRSAGDAEAGQAQRVERASRSGAAQSCSGDHCAGRELIAWKELLQGCSKGLRVGVIDTGVDHRHPAFAGHRLHDGNFVPEGRTPAENWHGTGVLAIMAGIPGSGTPGLIPQAEFFLASVFFTDGSGGFVTDTVSVLKALDWIDAFDVKVVNMSFAGPKDELVQKAIVSLSNRGVIFVASAGNEGPSAGPSYPAAYKQVIAVTAVNKSLRSYPFAGRGDHIDVAAPGVDVWTAVPDAKEGYRSGTSFATPFVTSMVATIYGDLPRPNKESLLGRLEVKDLGAPGRDPIYGRGLLVAPTECPSNASSGQIATRGQAPNPPTTSSASFGLISASPANKSNATVSFK